MLYYFCAQKEYTAEAIFQIKQENDGAINIPGELNSLALIVGLNTSQNSNLGMLRPSKDTNLYWK